MQISYLADYPGFISLLAPAIVEQWRFVMPEETIDGRIARLRNHLNRNTLPIGWIAHAGGQVLGTAALRVYDLEDRRDLTPWLGGVFVRPEYRRQGIASALCEVAEDKAWSLGFETLYLFTADRQALYARLGWNNLERVIWRGLGSTIMFKNRPPHRDSSFGLNHGI